MCVSQQYPTLSCSVPIFNYLFDRLEDEYDQRKKDKGTEDAIVKAIKESREKLRQYYSYTSGLIYAISTGK